MVVRNSNHAALAAAKVKKLLSDINRASLRICSVDIFCTKTYYITIQFFIIFSRHRRQIKSSIAEGKSLCIQGQAAGP